VAAVVDFFKKTHLWNVTDAELEPVVDAVAWKTQYEATVFPGVWDIIKPIVHNKNAASKVNDCVTFALKHAYDKEDLQSYVDTFLNHSIESIGKKTRNFGFRSLPVETAVQMFQELARAPGVVPEHIMSKYGLPNVDAFEPIIVNAFAAHCFQVDNRAEDPEAEEPAVKKFKADA